MARRRGSRATPTYEEATGAVPVASRLVVIVSCIAAIGAMVHGLWGELGGTRLPAAIVPEPSLSLTPSVVLSAGPLPAADESAAPSANQPSPIAPSTDPSPSVPRIGIVAGHWGSDLGATCPDGLAEVEINYDIAQRAVRILQELGYQADLLEEFDPRLQGYQADALVSIHADSCEAYPNATPPASGFKVASVEDSMVPEAEERLVACLAQCYAARTEMYFHASSITYDMTRYHTFYEIDGQTPGAIIETGFMLNDRHMLTQQPELVAQGIVHGIVCFVEDGGP